MIHYNLVCEADHEFDGWFAGSAAFDEQVARSLVTCPVCGSSAVSKALMTPGVPQKSNRKQNTVTAVHTPPDPRLQAMTEMVRQLKAHVKENADYVGDQFAEKARRIHYGEEEARGIYGEASMDDARELHEEGIDVLPLPDLPEDSN